MAEFENIRFFLRRVRRRARLESGVRTLALAGTALILAVLGLAIAASATGPAAFWPLLTTVVLPAVTLSVFALLVAIPWRRLRSDHVVAALVGTRRPRLASDLLSAVELSRPAAPHTSADLLSAFFGSVAGNVNAIAPAEIVPYRRAGRAVLVFTVAMAALLLLASLAHESVGRGLRLLTRRPTLFEGAAVSREPLVGDVKIVYSFPAYTRLPERTVEGSSGDIVALKGTRVSLQMHLLRSAHRGLLLLGDRGDAGQIETQIAGDLLRADFTISDSGRYHVWLAPLLGRPVREQHGHQIDADLDQAPVVEIAAPADRLELPAPRPIEVGYSATDDYGLQAVDLVYRVGTGPEKRIRLQDGHDARSAKGKTIWDPSGEALVPGVTIAYHIEARDGDAVSGSKAGSSRTLTLILERTRESADESIEEQRRILEALLGVLADRLEAAPDARADRSGSDPGAPPQADPAVTIPALVLASARIIHDNESEQVASLGRLVDQERRTGSASKSLLATLSLMADRLNRFLRDETVDLDILRTRQERTPLDARHVLALRTPNPAHMAALEDATLTLDDLIGRQRLEDLASLGRQLGQAYERLKDLLARYKASPDPAMREQLLREIEELQRRIAEMAAKVAAVKQRNEVPTEWQNMPDMRKAMADARGLQDALKRGDTGSMTSALDRLGEQLKSLQDKLSGNADEFAEQRFPRESRALAELMKKISNVEGDERQLAGDSERLSRALDQALAERRNQREADMLKAVEARMQELSDKLAPRMPRELGEPAAEDHVRAREHTERARRQMAGRAFPEIRKEIEETAKNLDHLKRVARRQTDRERGSDAVSGFMREMEQAAQMAREISEQLGQMTPSASDVASEQQRAGSREQSARQDAIARRAREMGEEAGREGRGMPGFDRAAGELREAADQMAQARENLSHTDPRAALGQEQAAADRLQRLRQSLGSEGMSRGSEHREPVPIPGQKDAPRAWRQELMDAMREKPPDKFREEVRRYYEELVK